MRRRERKAVARVGDRVLGEAPVDVAAGEAGSRAQVLAPAACSTRSPRRSIRATARRRAARGRASPGSSGGAHAREHLSHDLVAEHARRVRRSRPRRRAGAGRCGRPRRRCTRSSTCPGPGAGLGSSRSRSGAPTPLEDHRPHRRRRGRAYRHILPASQRTMSAPALPATRRAWSTIRACSRRGTPTRPSGCVALERALGRARLARLRARAARRRPPRSSSSSCPLARATCARIRELCAAGRGHDRSRHLRRSRPPSTRPGTPPGRGCELVARAARRRGRGRASARCGPSGHHAERERAMGFCLFNNVAVAAAAAIAEHGRRARVRARLGRPPRQRDRRDLPPPPRRAVREHPPVGRCTRAPAR